MIIHTRDYIPDLDLRTTKKGHKNYIRSYMVLDTETAWNHDPENPIGWIYQWAFRIDDVRVIGQRPSDFIRNLRDISDLLEDTKARFLVFVHNLSYDLQYLFSFLEKEFGSFEILALKPHKFIYFKIDKFEFRCTWRLSNRSLDKWARDLGTESQKLVGAIDYEKIHYQDEDLPEINWEYQLGDVDTLHDCIESQLALYGDTLATLPLTSTGYVRRSCRKHYKKDLRNRKKFLNSRMSSEVYSLLLQEFAGAIAHGNRFQVEKTIRGTIRHRDFVSHYPSQQRKRGFPIGKFILYKKNASFEDIEKIKKRDCCLCVCTFQNIELRDRKITIPTLSEAKCKQGKIGKCHFISDNGRVLKMDGITRVVMTEIDLEVFNKQYKVDFYNIEKVYVSTRGPIPSYIIDTVDEFMFGKTKFKEEEKREQDPKLKKEIHNSLMKSKNGLNGIYGMSAQRPVQPKIEMDSDGIFSQPEILTPEILEEELDKYYKNPKSFMRFCFGCWTTSWARWELVRFCEIIGWENVLYCDTDSAFYISTPEIEDRIETENKRIREESEKIGAYIEFEGKKIYYDQFDLENEDIVSFRFLHSKCYAYEIRKNDIIELKITIAGVPENESASSDFTREEELGSIDNLSPGFVFTRCGGTKSIYTNARPFLYQHEGHVLECAGSCIISKTTKTLQSFLDFGTEFLDWEVL